MLFAVAAAAILAVATGSAASAPVVAFSSGPAAKSPPQPVGDRVPGHPNKKALPAGADTYAPTYSTYRGEDAVGRYYSVTSGPIFDGRCTYGDRRWGPDLSIPIDLGDDLSARVDANGHPAPGNPIYGKQVRLELWVYDVDSKETSIPPEVDLVSMNGSGSGIGVLYGDNEIFSRVTLYVPASQLKLKTASNPNGRNTVDIDIDLNNNGGTSSRWCVGVYEARLRLVYDARPAVLVHGFTVSGDNGSDGDYGNGNGAGTHVAMQTMADRWRSRYPALNGRVIFPDVGGKNGLSARVQALTAPIAKLRDDTGAFKINMVGHSFGGLTVRRYAAQHPSEVDNVGLLGTPNGGSILADIACQQVNPPWYAPQQPNALQVILLAKLGFCNGEGDPLYELQESYVQKKFNKLYPDSGRIRYWTWAGYHHGQFSNFLPSGKENDGLVTVESAFWLRPGVYSSLVPGAPEQPGLEVPVAKYDVVHEDLHENTAPIDSALCSLYPPACGSGSFLAAKRPPKSSPPAPAPARQTGLAALQASDYAIGHEYVATVPAGGSTDVPVDFEGVNEATPFVISDQIDSLNVSYGLTTFAPDQLLGALDVLTATIPQPGSGSIHVVNSNAAAAATVRIVLGLQTTRQLAVTAAPALVRPGSPVTLTATLGDSVPADAVHLSVLNEAGASVAELDPSGSGGTWTGTFTPPAAGEYAVKASVGGSAPREAETSVSVAAGGATLGTGFTEQVVDDDGNGLNDALILKPTVNVTTAGSYRLSGRIVDAASNPVAAISTAATLATGTQTVDLRFEGSAISASGKNGPYRLVDVSLARDDASADFADQASDLGATTTAYSASSFEHARVTVRSGAFSEQTVDSNSDGFVDELRITGTADVETAGAYDVSGRLVAPDGTLVAEAGAEPTLATGGAPFTLSFAGADIGRSGKSGPYKLTEVAVASHADSRISGGLVDAYTTAAYSIGQFAAPEAGATATVGGSAVSLSLSSSNQNARFSFAGTAQKRVSVQVSGTLASGRVEFLQPDGTLLAATYLSGGGTFLEPISLPVSGTYAIVVDPTSGSGGTVTVRLYDVPADTTATIAAGGSATVTTAAPGQNGTLTFTGTVNQRVSVKLTSASVTSGWLSLNAPDGTVLDSQPIGTSGAFLDARTLTVAGTYTIVVDPAAAVTGSSTVNLYNVPADATAAMKNNSATVSTATPGQNARVTFSGTAGQKATFKLTSTAITAGTMSLLKPDGSTQASAPITSTGSFIDVQTLAVRGTYTILIDPSGAATGSSTVTLGNAADVTGTITAGGAAVTKSTTSAGQNVRLTFTGSVNQRVSVKATTASGITSGMLSLLKPDGSTLSSTPIASSAAFLDVVSLPVAGTYTILVDPDAAQIGSTTVNLYNVTDVSGTITPGGAAVPVSITTPGQNAKLTFSGGPGQRVSVNLTSSTLASATVKLVNPDSSVLASTTIGTSGGSIPVQELLQTGTYSVVVDPAGANTGNVTVTLGSGPSDVTGTITAGGPAVPVTISAADQNARLTFTGTTGQRVSVATSNSTISLASLSIRDSSWTALSSSTIFGSSGFLDTTTLPANGTYTVFLDPSGSSTGSVSLQLYTVPADTTGTIVAGGSPVTVTTSTPGQNATLTFSGVQNQRVSLKLTNDSIGSGYGCQAGVTIAKPSGGPPLAQNTCIQPPAPPFFDTMLLPETGTYTITVDPTDAATGSLTLQLYDVPADTSGTITPGGGPVTVTFSTPGQNGALTFSAASGQFTIAESNVTLGSSLCCSGKVSVVAGQTTELNPTYFGTFGASQTFSVTVGGTQTIVLDPQDDATGSVTFTLTQNGAMLAFAPAASLRWLEALSPQSASSRRRG